MEEIKERPTPPQLSKDLFRKITNETELERGQYLYEMLDQCKSHWQFKRFILSGICKQGLICLTDDGKKIIKNPYSLQTYRGHA